MLIFPFFEKTHGSVGSYTENAAFISTFLSASSNEVYMWIAFASLIFFMSHRNHGNLFAVRQLFFHINYRVIGH
jgi:hypothetical protein